MIKDELRAAVRELVADREPYVADAILALVRALQAAGLVIGAVDVTRDGVRIVIGEAPKGAVPQAQEIRL